MFTIDEFPGREITVQGKNFLYFGGTAYLGLQTDPEFQSFFIANVKKFGTGYGASRKSNVQISVFEKTETYLTNIVGSEACITLSSGYLAGQLVCDYFSQAAYQLFYAPNTHSALYRNGQFIYQDWSTLTDDLLKSLNLLNEKTPVIFLDSVDFEGVNFPDFNSLKSLPLEKIILVVDDSHGIGITGDYGGGSYRYLESLNPKELVVSCSLGKGFGLQAGAIFSSLRCIENLRNTQFYGGASPATPAAMATLLDADSIYPTKRKRLSENTRFFLEQVQNLALFSFTSGHPAFSFQNQKLSEKLEQERILVTNFRYPTSTSPLMSRIVLSALHTNDDIKKLCTIINSYNS
ncbi:aminotransferase class I/II-fold pyridoxal phosphate-dependent enzyme [Maribacter sp. X9]|uniref:aminotransferase class I/II-fold pyridoxal phosphate-dependent enzyme n=1 Tax=Maribacter sp. X9 TaxID=3402159 RepID=UPI003AF351D2